MYMGCLRRHPLLEGRQHTQGRRCGHWQAPSSVCLCPCLCLCLCLCLRLCPLLLPSSKRRWRRDAGTGFAFVFAFVFVFAFAFAFALAHSCFHLPKDVGGPVERLWRRHRMPSRLSVVKWTGSTSYLTDASVLTILARPQHALLSQQSSGEAAPSTSEMRPREWYKNSGSVSHIASGGCPPSAVLINSAFGTKASAFPVVSLTRASRSQGTHGGMYIRVRLKSSVRGFSERHCIPTCLHGVFHLD